MIDYKAASLNIGLPLQFVVKEYKMFDLFSKLLAAGWDLPLVGGSAINKIYLIGEERFSEDLDFELYGRQKLKLPEIDGYSIKGPFIYKRNIRFEAEYTETGKKDRIRIDINKKPDIKVKTIQKTAAFLTGNTIVNINTFSLEGLLARKLLSMTRRIEGKDFYDVWHSLLKINNKTLEKEIKQIAKIEKANNLVSDLKNKIENIDASELAKFNNYIPVERRPDWKLVKRDVLMLLEKFSG